MESAIREHDRKLILIGKGVSAAGCTGIEQVINAVNVCLETDCIFSLPSFPGTASPPNTEAQRPAKCQNLVRMRKCFERKSIYRLKTEKRKVSDILREKVFRYQ